MRLFTVVTVLLMMLAACNDQDPPQSAQSNKPAGKASPDIPPADRNNAGLANPKLNDADRDQARVREWTPPDQRPEPFDLDAVMLDQDGNELKLSDLYGKPMALSFMFTRCPDPNMCPLITMTTAVLEKQIIDAGLGDKVNIVLMSYDAIFDTPARLKTYGEARGVSFDNVRMVVAKDHTVVPWLLKQELSVSMEGGADGNFTHFIELILIDKQGRYARDYTGAIWDNHAVLKDLQKLAAE